MSSKLQRHTIKPMIEYNPWIMKIDICSKIILDKIILVTYSRFMWTYMYDYIFFWSLLSKMVLDTWSMLSIINIVYTTSVPMLYQRGKKGKYYLFWTGFCTCLLGCCAACSDSLQIQRFAQSLGSSSRMNWSPWRSPKASSGDFFKESLEGLLPRLLQLM